MGEQNIDQAFNEIIGDMQYTEFDEALGVCQEYMPVTDEAERLQAAVEALFAESGPYDEYTAEEKELILALAGRYVDELLSEGKLEIGDDVIASGEGFVLWADSDGEKSGIEVLGAGVRLHGLINEFHVMMVPVFMTNEQFFEPHFQLRGQLSVVLDIAQPGLEVPANTSRGTEARFEDLSHHDHVLLPLVYTKDCLQLKRRITAEK